MKTRGYIDPVHKLMIGMKAVKENLQEIEFLLEFFWALELFTLRILGHVRALGPLTHVAGAFVTDATPATSRAE